jgi:hypothetical protein
MAGTVGDSQNTVAGKSVVSLEKRQLCGGGIVEEVKHARHS